jgi:hypothetical protein
LKNLGGSSIDEGERKDAEIFYTKRAYEEYMREHNLSEKGSTIEDE